MTTEASQRRRATDRPGHQEGLQAIVEALEQGEETSHAPAQPVLDEQPRSRDDREVAQRQNDEKPPRGDSNAGSLAADESLGG